MGFGNSKEFWNEWRSTDWKQTNKEAMVNELRTFKLTDPDVGKLRFLLNGPIGAGKSSFINSVNNIFQGRITQSALAADSTNKSFTQTYKSHYIRNGTNCLPFVFNDVMGLEPKEGHGVCPEDIISALKGYIPEGYKFDPCKALTDESEEYISNPMLSDKVHCLVNVIAADKISIIERDVIEKITKIRETASELGIPQVVIMTMPDMLCPLVNNKMQKIYKSKAIKEMMQTCTTRLGVPMNCILPVKNYHDEIKLDNDMDILILTVMTQIKDYANDYIWSQKITSIQ